jgi:acetyl/propionyl-CoA carboxylase alpha subunit
MAREQRVFGYDGRSYTVSVERDGEALRLLIDNTLHCFSVRTERDGRFILRSDRGRQVGHAVRDRGTIWVQWNGSVFAFRLEDRTRRSGREAPARDEIHAPMTGTIRRVLMEHVLRAPRDGRIEVVEAREGQQAEAHALLVRLAPAASEP